ncbi:protein phosphatase 2A structural subunit TPD3 [Aspergillus clavatus NRRL 1]|uniref:Protein phosphotase 2a 65kd regulatory sububit n=1 Tax=Aspergillus clavatus (strain ATCC 1007 / CBS 513.65 / DSM 816 / NCTC 3887 / NRRL 1 / QM 1276 / 107) TaxID=344612 RepID=A1CRA5_ASPCL|nr:protein phosphatase 2a 65kd regulatory sububit [Aspergillus clavatus NRRL 1]EAW08176.1 protein phosphotase 2a 65kd regulatory sububit [Aspergillus clavatus NRRL 1]
MEGQGENDELYPIAVLIDELKHDEVTLRINAIHRLSTIALALGPERTRDELIPFLDDSVEDEDEVLTALSEELGNFVEYVGGPEFGHVLLSPLENLAAIEEPLVREKAVESLNKIGEELSEKQIEEFFVPMVLRLSKADWFTSKVSATGLYCIPYRKSQPSVQQSLRQYFGGLVHDETPMVRRQAANNLAKLVKEMQTQVIIDEMIPLFQYLASDDQDSVRLLTVDILISIAEEIPKEQQPSHGVLLTSLRNLFEDKSWRVRYMVADRYEKIAKAVHEEVVTRDMVPSFVKLLKDTEAEVRTAIAGQIPGFCSLIDRETLLNEIMTSVEDLVSDQSQHVRAALGTQISGLAPILGKEETISHLLPMFLQMLKDDFPDVRLHIISKLELVNKVIGIDLLSQSLLPAIVQLAEDKQWRVRLAIIEYIPLLASQLGVKFFDEQLSDLCMGWLGDTVFSIREAATQNLRKLTEVFGVEWAQGSIIPKVMAMGQHPNYLYRMTTCFAISTLAPVVSLDIIENSILPILDRLVTDEIPNIRFNVAKSYAILIDALRRLPSEGTLSELEKAGKTATPSPRGQDLIQQRVLPSLEKLQQDEDVDVRYFATTAAGGHEEVMQTSP